MTLRALAVVASLTVLFYVTSAGTSLRSQAKIDSSQALVLPLPQKITVGTATVTLKESFSFHANVPSGTLKAAFVRYGGLIFSHGPVVAGEGLESLDIEVASDDETLELGTDESYSLDITGEGNGSRATLKANTVYGALRGMETFSQLVVYNFDDNTYNVDVTPVSIQDAPRFPYRGLLVDTSRHYQPTTSIKQVIDSMAYAKLNVLHWHVVDSQSFPYQSLKYPKLWAGAYSPQARYTQGEIKEIIEYARLRAVRVMIEFDVPGHAASWGKGYPDLWPRADCQEPLDPSKDSTFELLDGLLTEAANLFPAGEVHLGGDEVNTDCWTKTPAVQEWLTAKNFTADQAYMYFVEQAHKSILAAGKSPVNWEEVFNHFGSKLDKSTIIHIWLDHATLAKVVAAGYRAILSNNDVWYLDHLDTTWQQFYLNEPFVNITDPNQQKLVIGGEVCMWGETVDQSDIQQTVWPRAAAAAERLWSAQEVNDVDALEPRLSWFRCFLNGRGIAAAPTQNKSARSAPSGPGGCLAQ